MDSLDTARLIARLAHHGQTYVWKGEETSYFKGHICQVVLNLWEKPDSTAHDLMAAYLHDIFEDTDVTQEELIRAGIPYMVVETVLVLTRRGNEGYFNWYIPRVKRHDSARRVKIADLEVNLESHPPGALKKRYIKALAILKEGMP